LLRGIDHDVVGVHGLDSGQLTRKILYGIWTASWRTNYDFDTQRFADHYLSLNRELHDWRASFAFTRTATGNFAFTFYVALIAEPDIKFDYDQQSFKR